MKFTTFAEPRPFLLVFDKQDEVIGTLRRFAREQGIRGGRFAAIGALSRAVVAYWNPEKLGYEKVTFDEQVEVLALVGDVAREGDEVKIHGHIVLGRRDGSTVGGHLVQATVFPTVEMHFVDYGATVQRKKDAATKLSLIAIGKDE